MGIQNFFQWIRGPTVRGIENVMPEESVQAYYGDSEVDHLFIDSNAIVYTNVERVFPKVASNIERSSKARVEHPDLEYLNKQLKRSIWNDIQRIVGFMRPRKSLYILFDGCPPMAKIKNQKESRYFGGSRQAQYFDLNSISPGTKFMSELNTYLTERIWKAVGDGEFPPNTNLGGHLVPGEGEHKIFDILRARDPDGYPIIPPNDYTVIHGMDSDLVVISTLYHHRIFLYREFVHTANSLQDGRIYYLDSARDMTKEVLYYAPEVVNLRKLRRTLYNKVSRNDYNEKDASDVLAGFALVTFLVGNDFIPINPEVGDAKENLERLCEIYKDSGDDPLFYAKDDERLPELREQQLGDVGTINMDRIIDFLEALLRNEANPKTSLRMAKSRSGVPLYRTRDFRNDWYTHALRQRGGQSVNPSLLINEKVILHMSLCYLSALCWNLRYYRYGQSGINPEFFYPYAFAPLLIDVWAAAILCRNGKVDLFHINSRKMEYSVFHQLLLILPRTSGYLLRKDFRIKNINKFYAKGAITSLYLPTSFCFENDFTGTSAEDLDYDTQIVGGNPGSVVKITRRRHVHLPPPNLHMLNAFLETNHVYKPEEMRRHLYVEFFRRGGEKEDYVPMQRYADPFRYQDDRRRNGGNRRIVRQPDVVPDAAKEEENKQKELNRVKNILSLTIKGYREATLSGGFRRRPRNNFVFTNEELRVI